MGACYRCRGELGFEGRVPREATCPSCHSDVHVCANCRFHDRSAHNQCREPAAEFVRDKERTNFCEFFELTGARAGRKGPGSAKDAFDSLFGSPDKG
jgi:hypothetical protein